MNVSDKIKNLNKSKGYTLEDLAKKIGVVQPSLSRMLKSNDFKLSTLQKIADVLEVDISYFFEQNNSNGIAKDDIVYSALSKIVNYSYEQFKGRFSKPNSRDLPEIDDKLIEIVWGDAFTLNFESLTDAELESLYNAGFINSYWKTIILKVKEYQKEKYG